MDFYELFYIYIYGYKIVFFRIDKAFMAMLMIIQTIYNVASTVILLSWSMARQCAFGVLSYLGFTTPCTINYIFTMKLFNI